MGAGGGRRPAVHHHQRLRHPDRRQKETVLESSPITKNLTAVKNRCFLSLSYDEVTLGPCNAAAVMTIASWLYPEIVDLPADGS